MRTSLLVAVSLVALTVGCNDGLGARISADAGPSIRSGLVEPVEADALPSVVEADVRPADAGTMDAIGSAIDVLSADTIPSAPEAGAEAQMGPEAGLEVQADTITSAPEAGHEAMKDGPQPLPAACVTPQVTGSTTFCDGTWPGTNTQCIYSCVGYDPTDPCHDAPPVAGVQCSKADVFSETGLLCNAYRRLSKDNPNGGGIVVCVRGRELCDVYCPVPKS